MELRGSVNRQPRKDSSLAFVFNPYALLFYPAQRVGEKKIIIVYGRFLDVRFKLLLTLLSSSL